MQDWLSNMTVHLMNPAVEINPALIALYQGKDVAPLINIVKASCKRDLEAAIKRLLPKRPKVLCRGLRYFDTGLIMPSSYAVTDWMVIPSANIVLYQTLLVTLQGAMYLMNVIEQDSLKFGAGVDSYDWGTQLGNDCQVNNHKMPVMMKASSEK